LLALVFGTTEARAADEKGPDSGGITAPSIATSLPDNGDPGGVRRELANRGITYDLFYTNDVLANVQGGIRRGTIDQGKIEGALTIDLEKAAGWQGLTFFANGFQIHNTGRIRRDYVGGINTIAAIEAHPTIRLSELWLERKFADGKLSIRVGQLTADTEFFFSGLSAMFLQSDWATIVAVDLPSGGPAYPLSTPGARLKWELSPDASLLLALFNGDPAGPGHGDPQLRNRYGLNFRVNDPPFIMAEAQLRSNTGKLERGLARTLKAGVWTHVGAFDDLRLGEDGMLLADPASSGHARRHEGHGGAYAVVEQQLYRPLGGDAESGVSVFARVSASPSDRSLVDFFVDGGIIFAGLIPRRPNDKFGASVMYSHFSDAARAFDRDLANFGTVGGLLRDFESNLELNYQAQIIPGWTVQPVAQFVWHPSEFSHAGLLAMARPDAIVVGVRSYWHY
jgi:porin